MPNLHSLFIHTTFVLLFKSHPSGKLFHSVAKKREIWKVAGVLEVRGHKDGTFLIFVVLYPNIFESSVQVMGGRQICWDDIIHDTRAFRWI